MKELLFRRQWGWKTSGVALGLIIMVAVMLVKPIGVSTQYVIFDGIVWNIVNTELVQTDVAAEHGHRSSNRYLNENGGKYAKAVGEPLSYGIVFVLSMILGGFIASKLSKSDTADTDTLIQQQRFGTDVWHRYCAAFIGGLLVLLGARLAGGCTSGHMMSGTMQTSYSAYVFTASVLIIAIPVALLLYRRPNTTYTD